MRYPSRCALKILFSVGFLLHVMTAYAITPMIIKKETDKYVIDIKYPQGFQSSEVNSIIKEFIEKTQQQFIQSLSDDADVPADAPGKTGLNITYSLPYQSNNALSVRFNLSTYHRGAAHPANNVVVKNFIDGHPVQLTDLFVFGSDYLKPIAVLSQKAITAKDISDDKWIAEGTKPEDKNYEVWAFNTKGIDIIFNSYQVAAYVYGEQTVTIPLDAISSMLKPKMSATVWGR